MKGVSTIAALMVGAMMLTSLLGNALQERALSGHSVDSSYRPDAEATTDRWGWPVLPKPMPEPDAGALLPQNQG